MSQWLRFRTLRGCLIVALPRSRSTSTSYDMVNVLPFIAKRMLGFIPTAWAKSGDMALSSDPESKHMSASTPLILRMAVGQHPIQVLGCGPLDWLGFAFEFEAHVFWLLVFSCWAEGPWKVVFISLPCDSYCSFIEETSSFAIF